jgi:hypothetical protein
VLEGVRYEIGSEYLQTKMCRLRAKILEKMPYVSHLKEFEKVLLRNGLIGCDK